MLRSCISCKAFASPDIQLQHCAACQSAWYCSKDCQTEDWKKQHKKICQFLSVGQGNMQVREAIHTILSIALKEVFEIGTRSYNVDVKRFFRLFEESTFEGSQVAARKMKKIAKRKTKHNQEFMFFSQ
jgi:hypothetical protein